MSSSPKKKGYLSVLQNVTWSQIPSLLISCFALCISLFAAVISYNSAKNAVRPVLSIDVGDIQSPIPCFGLYIRNNGMGPARVNSVRISFDGQLIPDLNDVQKVISRKGFQGRPIDFEVLASNIDNGMIIGAGQDIFLYAGNKEMVNDVKELESLLKRVGVHVVYSSVAAHDYEAYFPYKELAVK